MTSDAQYEANMARGGGISVQGAMALAYYKAQLDAGLVAQQAAMANPPTGPIAPMSNLFPGGQQQGNQQDSQPGQNGVSAMAPQTLTPQQIQQQAAMIFSNGISNPVSPMAPQPVPPAPQPGQASVPMQQPQQQGGMPPAPQSGPMQPQAQAAMAQIMRPQQPPSAMAPTPMPAQQPQQSSSGDFLSDPQTQRLIAYGKKAFPNDPQALDSALKSYYPIWKDKQTQAMAQQRQSSMDQRYQQEAAQRQQSAVQKEQNTLGAWASAPEGIEDNPLKLDKDTYLATLPASIQAQVKGLSDGSQPWPTGLSLRSPGTQKTLAAVYAYDPSANAARYPTLLDFSKGPAGKQVQSFNTATNHLNLLAPLADALDNGDVRAVNTLGNAFSTQTGSSAPTNFDAAKQIVADEIVKAVTGYGGAESDRENLQKSLDKANSPEQLKGVITTFKGLMSGQLDSLQKKYEAGTGRDDFDRFLTDAAKKNADKSPQSSPGSASGVVSYQDYFK
jgi:hypothetical protein